MLRIERILCPTDFSEFSATAYEYARSLSQHYGAKLFLLHVVQPLAFTYPTFASPNTINQDRLSIRGHAEEELRKFVKTHTPNGAKSEGIVEEGMVMDSLLSFAERRNLDLIVMGTHGRQGLDRVLLGSVTEKVLRKANCPVLVVRKPVHGFLTPQGSQDPIHIRKILFCTDFSAHSERALEYALSLAMEYNAELRLVHVLEDLRSSAELQSTIAETARRLDGLVPRDSRDWCTVKSTVRLGKPYQEIVQLALEERVDLVILGVRGRNVLDLALFGSTTHRVIQLGSCPVLAVHI